MRFVTRILISISFFISASTAFADSLRLAVTTSFNNSGLSDLLLPEIKTDLGFDVHLLVVGTGQALKHGKSGDVDAILVHSKSAEEAFIAEGYATHRREIMYNDFVFIGPSRDPADLSNAKTAIQALQKIQQAGASILSNGTVFVSRGDNSGTHKKELSLWEQANLIPNDLSRDWYRQVGAGMGAALNTASGMNAYILSDRASWLKFANKGDLKLLFSGDPKLHNQYAYLPINPARHAHVKHDQVLALENWLVSEKAQSLIGEYRINGERLFVPNAQPN